jgi:hypothetical protein
MLGVIDLVKSSLRTSRIKRGNPRVKSGLPAFLMLRRGKS